MVQEVAINPLYIEPCDCGKTMRFTQFGGEKGQGVFYGKFVCPCGKRKYIDKETWSLRVKEAMRLTNHNLKMYERVKEEQR